MLASSIKGSLSLNNEKLKRYLARVSLSLKSQPVFWRTPVDVHQANTFFSRDEVKTLWGYTQQMAHADPILLSRLSEPSIKWIKAWEYGRLLAILCDVAGTVRLKSFLDLGTGNSTFPAYIRRRFEGLNAVTLDYNASFEPQANLTMRIAELSGTRQVYGSMLELPFDPDSFDLVTCISAIEHLDEDPVSRQRLAYATFVKNTKTALREMAKVIRPGGFLFLTTDVYVPELQDSDGFNKRPLRDAAKGLGKFRAAYSIYDIDDSFVQPLVSAGFTLVDGYDYSPELLINNSDRSTYRGRYFTTLCLFAQKQ